MQAFYGYLKNKEQNQQKSKNSKFKKWSEKIVVAIEKWIFHKTFLLLINFVTAMGFSF